MKVHNNKINTIKLSQKVGEEVFDSYFMRRTPTLYSWIEAHRTKK